MRTVLRGALGLWIAAAALTLAGCPEGETVTDFLDAPRVDITGPATVEAGKTITLMASTSFDAQDGAAVADSGYTWTSTAAAFATVDDAGMVTGVAKGVAVIEATGKTSGIKGSHTVVVFEESTVQPGTPVVIVAGDFVVAAGGTVTLTAATTNGTDSSYAWATSDDTVATVDMAGVVTGVDGGEAIITATGADTGAAGSLGIVVTTEPVEPPPALEPPFLAEWSGSAHADAEAEAFNHWNEDGEIPASCAKCHSQDGYLDFLGVDGSPAGTVDAAAPLGTVVSCQTCHNAGTVALSSVTFPSGAEITGLGSEARCMQCHQGRSSTTQVDAKIAAAAAADDDTVSETLSFQNVHYLAAGATLYGGLAKGGYQYDGQAYDAKNDHVAGLDSCVTCHDSHSLEPKLDACATCHQGVTDTASLAGIRVLGSTGDYDGDGDTEEGIQAEIEGLQATLVAAIQAYGKDKAGAAIVYDAHSYPYFFADANGNGAVDEGESKYASWTNRLLRAAYNYQYSLKDPGAFAHHPKYVIELLFDSITDLNSALAAPVAFAGARSDAGHFDGASEAFRHWDEDGEVSASCSKCHSGPGFQFYTQFGTSAPQEPSNGLACMTCHTDLTTFAVAAVDSVTYPSGKVIEAAGSSSNLCATCHSGREAKASVDAAIAADELGFKNVHYLPAAATLNGADAQVGYEYDGKTYAAKWTHAGGTECISCHAPKGTKHTFDVHDNKAACKGCHGSDDIDSFRLTHAADYDGDAAAEGLKGEIETLTEKLLAQIVASADAAAAPISYDAHAYPYWFGADGKKYAAWTPALMKAAFNYQLSRKEPGAWAHNFAYIAQLLYDSIEDLGGATATAGLTRP